MPKQIAGAKAGRVANWHAKPLTREAGGVGYSEDESTSLSDVFRPVDGSPELMFDFKAGRNTQILLVLRNVKEVRFCS